MQTSSPACVVFAHQLPAGRVWAGAGVFGALAEDEAEGDAACLPVGTLPSTVGTGLPLPHAAVVSRMAAMGRM
ncbi:hypothetical protein BIV25_41255 [Streptomyces sp. MUSC 14]|nr:hypothetical protein BIV25_41255 [Streptomyces sp. MUSC 14]